MSGNEKRLHRRISGVIPDKSYLDLGSEGVVSVKNISYGGFAAQLDKKTHENFSSQDTVKLKLHVLGCSVETEVKVVNRVKDITGFAIVHSGVEALMFLRGIFEFWQNGTTARIVASDHSHLDVDRKDQIFVNADGPTDMILSKGSNPALPSAIITYMTDGDYSQIDFVDGVFKTGKAFGESKMPGSSIRMDAELDVDTLRQTTCFLAGIEAPAIQAKVDELLKCWVEKLCETK